MATITETAWTLRFLIGLPIEMSAAIRGLWLRFAGLTTLLLLAMGTAASAQDASAACRCAAGSAASGTRVYFGFGYPF